MRIVVVGAGEVGSYVAALLSREGNDVVVVDERRDPLTRIERANDVLTVDGRLLLFFSIEQGLLLF